MYRLVSASKDTYITSKIISGRRCTDANTGRAGTLDLYSLYNETQLLDASGSVVSGTTIELSRLLVQFNYNDIVDANINVASPNFTASLVLKNVYGGQTTPSNFSLVAFPVSTSWEEGRGFDVVSYRDLDAANFLSSSVNIPWNVSGANATGSLGDANTDIIVSGNIGSGLEYLGSICSFNLGNEDAVFNVTKIVSASVSNQITNNGFRISFIEGQEGEDGHTRFVKRFGSRQSFNKDLHPKLVLQYKDDRIIDTSGDPELNVNQSFYTYNYINNGLILNNFTSGGVDITGSNSLVLELAISKSIEYITSSYQANFSASINHLTRSVVYFSQSYSASQVSNGVYVSNFNLDYTTTPSLYSFLTGSEIASKQVIPFKGSWKSLDGSVLYSYGFFDFKRPAGLFVAERGVNYILNVTNLQDAYNAQEGVVPRLRVFVQNHNLQQPITRQGLQPKPVILRDLRWRLKKAFDPNVVVVPFCEATRLSTDNEGMYFDLYVQDLDINEVYELEFLIKNQLTGKDILVENKGFIFKVIK